MKKSIILFLIVLFFACFLSKVFAEQIDINSATSAQLDELTGIGPTYAQRIIDSRPYSLVDDLLRVKGIGPATLQKIKDQGFACVNCSTQKNSETQNPITPAPAQVPSSEPTPTPATTPPPVSAIVYPSGVFINEILPSPKGADETDEWIELYNSNNSDVDLSNWQIKDSAGTITVFTIPKDVKILANGYIIFKRPETNIMLNNDEDGLGLLTPDSKIEDSMSYSKAPLGQSYNKHGSGFVWSTALTPGVANIITAVASNSLPKTKKSDNSNIVEATTADISQTTNSVKSPYGDNGASPWFLFFLALAITIVLAVVVLFIKFKLVKNNVRT